MQSPARICDVVLRDGSTVRIRPATAGDKDGLEAFFASLSSASLATRFMSGGANLAGAARWAADVDDTDRYGLVALHGSPPAVIAHAGFVRTGASVAEVALEVQDAFQGLGMGTILLGQLAEAAERRGIDVFEGDVSGSNYRMMEVFRESGFTPTLMQSGGGGRPCGVSGGVDA